ncbi:NADPH-dependent FMN reductase [Paenibacillus protaetiae]|uniref:FMN reductase (NADPH) n=1 Tax=Paenibacillus protaetiae TaxID=2509456 RepID=A0A4P6EXF9_9BACL|nr:NADPH-dependent FMN reductase [Paenibacillus protaetiae]QAY67345.1 FMN reductase (NADPH) [Paenibacillus protaetiae]
MSKAVIISGSPNASSRLNGLIQYVEQQLSDFNISVELITVASLPPEDLIYTNFSSPAIVAANQLVAEADAVIIASPVYKASYTGVLKTFIDLIPEKGFAGKVIAPLFIGGSSAHLLSMDYSLKPVASALGARIFASGVYAIDKQIERTTSDDGQFLFNVQEELKDRLHATAAEIAEELRLRSK